MCLFCVTDWQVLTTTFQSVPCFCCMRLHVRLLHSMQHPQKAVLHAHPHLQPQPVRLAVCYDNAQLLVVGTIQAVYRA